MQTKTIPPTCTMSVNTKEVIHTHTPQESSLSKGYDAARQKLCRRSQHTHHTSVFYLPTKKSNLYTHTTRSILHQSNVRTPHWSAGRKKKWIKSTLTLIPVHYRIEKSVHFKNVGQHFRSLSTFNRIYSNQLWISQSVLRKLPGSRKTLATCPVR